MKTRFLFISIALISLFMMIAIQGRSQKVVDNVYQLTDQDFDKFIKKDIVLVDFWAVWCGPCRTQGPIIDEIAKEVRKKTMVAKVNVDVAKVTAARFSLKYIPTIIIFKNGELVKRFTGLQSKEVLTSALDSLQ